MNILKNGGGKRSGGNRGGNGMVGGRGERCGEPTTDLGSKGGTTPRVFIPTWFMNGFAKQEKLEEKRKKKRRRERASEAKSQGISRKGQSQVWVGGGKRRNRQY